MKNVVSTESSEAKSIFGDEPQTTIQQNYDRNLSENERRLQEAERMAQLGHWELEIKTNKLHWSAETFRIFELNPLEHEPSLASFLELIHPEDREHVLREYRNSVENRTQYNVYHRILLKSGAIKFLNERCRTRYDTDGQPTRSFGTVLDMTDHRKQVDKLLKAQSGLKVYASGLEDEIERLNKQLEDERAELAEARKRIATLTAKIPGAN
jgi:PAS domain-containing protein